MIRNFNYSLAPPPHPYPRTATISPLGIYLWHTSTSYFSNVGRLLILQQARFVWQGRPLGDVWQLKEEWHRRLNVPKWQSRLNVDPDQNTSRALGWMKWHLVLHFQQFVDFLWLLRIVGGFFVFSMKALKKVEKCNELIDIHWPIKGPERHFALMVSPYMYNIYTMRIINNLLTRKAKRKMKRRKKKQCLLLLLQMPPRILLFLEYWRRGFSHWSSPPGMGSSTGSCSPATSEGSAFSAQKRLNCHKYLHINWKEKKI